jgi:hypothetical protein
MLGTQKLHSFIQNYIIIIAWTQLKCKSYILHIKTSQVEKIHHLYKNHIYIYIVSFLHFEAHGFCMNIFFMIFIGFY